jgi:hypothetical protein
MRSVYGRCVCTRVACRSVFVRVVRVCAGGKEAARGRGRPDSRGMPRYTHTHFIHAHAALLDRAKRDLAFRALSHQSKCIHELITLILKN